MALAKFPIHGLLALVATVFAFAAPVYAVDRYHVPRDYIQAVLAVPLGVVFGVSAARCLSTADRVMGWLSAVLCGGLLIQMVRDWAAS
jgi:hypothetical protein